MSATTKHKVDKFLKTKKLDKLQGKYAFSFRWPLTYSLNPEQNFISTPTFTLCGSMWSLCVYPIGIDDTSEYISVRLVNMSPDEVFATYFLSIKNQKGGKDHTWKDPEGIVLFSGEKEGDNAWGSDEFISLQELSLRDDFTANESITFEVEMEVFGRDYLKTETLSKAILDTAEKSDIIKLADEEILELTKKLPVLRNSVAQKKQEDGIVRALAHATVSTSHGSHHYK